MKEKKKKKQGFEQINKTLAEMVLEAKEALIWKDEVDSGFCQS